MKTVSNSLNITILGDWNKFYLDPQWIATNIFQTDTVQLEFVGNGFDFSTNFKNKNVTVLLSQSRIIFSSSDLLDTSVDLLETTVFNFFKQAKTPMITAYGINIKYSDANASEYSRMIDGLYDTNKYSLIDADIVSTTINRKIIYKTSEYNLSFNQNNGELIVNINMNVPCGCKNEEVKFEIGSIKESIINSTNIMKSCGYVFDEGEKDYVEN